MLTREIAEEERALYDSVAVHPLQSWEWGRFRQETGIVVRKFGTFDNNVIKSGFQVFFHLIPKTSYTIGYIPRGPLPTKEMIEILTKIAPEHNCIFVKMEPNVPTSAPEVIKIFNGKSFSQPSFASLFPNMRVAKKPLFTQHTFYLDLTLSEEQLMSQMKDKTRYNVRLAQRKGVTVSEDSSKEAFETYLKLTMETTKRQKFFAHDQMYHETMWKYMQQSGIGHLLTARYNNEILVTWIVFLFNNVLYYPYGASSDRFREVMASNLMMWEAMRFGKSHGAHLFDLWGALGPNPDPKHKWYGFNRFKEGYGGTLVEFVGSYDYVPQPTLYKFYNVAERVRWMWLEGMTLLWSVPPLW